MSPRLPTLKPRELLQVLQKAGFLIDHQTGSHVILRHPGTKQKLTLALHNRDLKRGAQAAILKQAGISQARLRALLGQD